MCVCSVTVIVDVVDQVIHITVEQIYLINRDVPLISRVYLMMWPV